MILWKYLKYRFPPAAYLFGVAFNVCALLGNKNNSCTQMITSSATNQFLNMYAT